MAKYTVNCTDCNCNVEVNLLGKTSNREWMLENVEWLCHGCANTLFSNTCKICGSTVFPKIEYGNVNKKSNLKAYDVCPTCFKNKWDQKKQENGIPAITGKSEKHINYGEMRRTTILKSYFKHVEYFQEILGADCFSEFFYTAVEQKIKNETNASKWIDWCNQHGFDDILSGFIYTITGTTFHERYKDIDTIISILKFKPLNGIEKLNEDEQLKANLNRKWWFAQQWQRASGPHGKSTVSHIYYICNYHLDAYLALHLRDTPVCSVGLNQYFELVDDGDAEKWYAFYYGISEENKEMKMKSIRDFYGD